MTITSIEADIAVNPTIKKPPVGFKVLIFIAKAPPSLERVLYIYHLVRFKKDQTKIQALLDFGNEVNTMAPAYIVKLGLKV